MKKVVRAIVVWMLPLGILWGEAYGAHVVGLSLSGQEWYAFPLLLTMVVSIAVSVIVALIYTVNSLRG